MTIRLKDLPLVALELVLRFFDVNSLINLSLIPQNELSAIIARIRTIEKLRLEVWLTGNQKSVSIFTCPSDCTCIRPEFLWEFNSKRMTRRNMARPVVTRRIQGVPVQMRNTVDGFYHTRRTARDERQIGAVISHFLQIFPRMDVSKVYIFVDNIMGFRTVLSSLRNAEKLELSGNELIFNDDFKYFFENINVSKKFVMNSRPSDRFRCPEEKTFDCDEIEIQQAHFLLPIHLLTMKCVKASLFFATFSDDVLLAFIRNWMGSDAGDVRFQQMTIHLRRSRSPLELAEFDAKEFAVERRARFFKLSDENRLDCLNGMDIQRRSDGLLATVMTNFSRFYFVVWHDKFPDTSNCTSTFQ